MESIQKIANGAKKKYAKRPRYTLVLHDVRDRLGLSWHEYGVIDSIHKLSHSDRNHLYCTASKDQLAKFLGIARRTVFRSIDIGLKKGFLEKNERGDLRTTQTWIDTVELYRDKD